MDFWTLKRNGGDGWCVGDLPGDCSYNFGDDNVTKYFATSYELCLKKQVVDLLAEGFSPGDLDAQPAVTVNDYYSGLGCCGCIYMLTVRLFNENMEVLQEFKPEPVTLNPESDDMSWRQVSHTFSDYGPGLRFISFKHGGKDTKWWKGHYGVRVTGSSVTVEIPQASPARNLLKNPAGNDASPEQLCAVMCDDRSEESGDGETSSDDSVCSQDLMEGMGCFGIWERPDCGYFNSDSEESAVFDEQMEFWEVLNNGGDGWCVGDLPGDCSCNFGDDKVTKYFATSYELCLKKQVVDLLAEGFSPEELNAQPAVTVKDYYSGLGCCGCIYMLTVRLLNENMEVLQEFKPEPVTLNPDSDDMFWRQVSHTFSDYGPGLRFISFEHGGKDTKWWKGHYGVRVTGSSVTVQTTQASPARNLLKNLDGNGASPEGSDESFENRSSSGDPQNFNIPDRNLLKNPSGEEQMELWKLKRNGGDGWCVGNVPEDCGYDFGDEVSKYFATSYELCQKKQVIDLLAEGYSSDYLDAQPAVTVKDYYSGLGCCGCIYKLTVRLLDKKKKKIQEFKPEPVTLDPDDDDMSWRQVSHTFSDYGPGLRFISFKHGGKDTKWWKGHYGVRVTGSSVTVGAPRQQEA